MSLAAAAIVLGVAACHRTSVPLPMLSPVERGDAALATRGEYLVRSVASCGGCHGADHAADGPLTGGAEFKDWRLGTARAANLTPDVETGLGAWSDAEIVRALRTGEAKDGRLLAPVMPYEWFNGMSDEDALAVARYLKSLTPMRNPVRQRPNFTFKFAKAVFLGPKSGGARSAPRRGPTAEYGAYLSQHVGLCAECHTPRGGLEAKAEKDKLFAGDAHPSKDFPANPSNLTPDSATGIGRWSEADFIRTIRTGVDPRGDSLNPFMPWRQNRRMTDDDLRAIYRYLKTLTPIHNEVPRRAPAPKDH
jgi:mono/diheme cytochrome c family protein